jgi:hypothetical protein
MRQALEAALGRWDTVQAPDYGQEFGRVCQSVGKLERRLAAVEQSGLVSNPYELVEQVWRMCSRGISDQAKTIEDTVQLANEAIKGMSGVVASARVRQHQSNWVWGFFPCGILFSDLTNLFRLSVHKIVDSVPVLLIFPDTSAVAGDKYLQQCNYTNALRSEVDRYNYYVRSTSGYSLRARGFSPALSDS